MNDADFDNIFGGKLKRGKNFIFAEESWDRMEKNIQQYDRDRNRKRGLLWLILPFLLLSGFAAWSSISMNKLSKKVSDLNTEISKLQTTQSAVSANENKTLIVKNDTIYHHVVTTMYDTIYRTVVLQNTISQNSKQTYSANSSSSTLETVASNKAAFLPSSTEVPVYSKENKRDASTENSLNQEALNNVVSENAKNKMRVDSLLKISEKNDLEISRLSAQLEKLQHLQPVVVPQEAVAVQPVPINPTKTHKFELGITGGAAAYKGDSIVNQTGYSVGLQGNYLIYKRLKLVAEAQLASSDYQKNTIYYTPDVPWIAAPTKNDVFSRVYCDQFYLNYSLGLQYALTENKVVNPYLGIGVVGQSKIKEQFDYRFVNTSQSETSVIAKRDDPNFKFPFLRLNVGAEIRLLKKISTQIEGSYDMKLNSDNYSKSFFQLRGVVLYKL